MTKTPQRRKDGSAVQSTSKDAAAHRRKVFVEEYLANGGIAKFAAIKAGYSAKCAEQQGSRLMKDPAVRRLLDERRTVLANSMEITTERVLREMARIAFFDPRRLFNADGTPKPLNELDDDTAAALAGLDVMEAWEGSGKDRMFVGWNKKYRIANKVDALDKLMKNLGLFDKDNAQKGKAEAEALRTFLQSIYGDKNRLPIARS